jgi:gas vesicle protein
LLAPKTGKELRQTLSSQADSLLDQTGSLRENVKTKSNDLISKTSSLSQGLVKQSSELINMVKSKAPNQDDLGNDLETNYIPIQQPSETPTNKKSIEIKSLDSTEIKKRLEETQRAFDAEESKVKF